MKEVKIIIKDNWGDLVLTTTDKTYKNDLLENKEKLNLAWGCKVEYDDGCVGYDYPYNHNGKSPRKVMHYKEKRLYANYNFTIPDGFVENVYDKLIEFLDEDFC